VQTGFFVQSPGKAGKMKHFPQNGTPFCVKMRHVHVAAKLHRRVKREMAENGLSVKAREKKTYGKPVKLQK
jgi:hypothetical protein